MATKDYIQSKDADFHNWQKNFVEKANLYKSGWDLSDDAETEWTLLTNTTGVKLKAWEPAWIIVSSGEFTHSQDVAKNEARKSYESGNAEDPTDTSIRLFIARYIRNNPKVTNQQKAAMGLTVADDSKSPSPGVEASNALREVVGNMGPINHLLHRSNISTPGVESKAKGDGVDAIEIWIAITEATVTECPGLKEFMFVGEASRGIYTHQFEMPLLGKKAWYIARKRFTGKKKTWGPFCLPWYGLIS